MTGKERIAITLTHKEADRVPYDLGGTTVTAITKNAYINAMKERGLSSDYEKDEVDPISQIVMPVEENLIKLKSDTRRIGAMRIPEYLARREMLEDGVMRVNDYYGCDRPNYHPLVIGQVPAPQLFGAFLPYVFFHIAKNSVFQSAKYRVRTD